MDELTLLHLYQYYSLKTSLLLKMAVRSNSIMPFSIQAILNKKENSRHGLTELDMCFSKNACWKIFGEMDNGPEDLANACRSDKGTCVPSDHKSYDSDSGLSDDNHSNTIAICKPEKDRDRAADVLEESLQEETDHESTAVENAKGISDCEPSVSGKITITIMQYQYG